MTKSNKRELNRMRAVSASVGDFIRYWGFRRIHGQLWTHLYLSTESLSGAELARRLGVSKALVSPALAELQSYRLIRAAGGDGKTKLFTACADVTRVMRTVLETRERVLIERARRAHENLAAETDQDSAATKIHTVRLESLGGMIAAASLAIEMIIEMTDSPSNP